MVAALRAVRLKRSQGPIVRETRKRKPLGEDDENLESCHRRRVLAVVACFAPYWPKLNYAVACF
jgi:hypothetical protein